MRPVGGPWKGLFEDAWTPYPRKGLFKVAWKAQNPRKGLLKDGWEAPYRFLSTNPSEDTVGLTIFWLLNHVFYLAESLSRASVLVKF